MPLPLPNLDTRRWADLVEEGRALIPRYAPEWTDHNAHDPGITLVELFAWLTEGAMYRANRVTDRNRRKFLSLLGYDPLPPKGARLVMGFHHGGGVPRELPAGLALETELAGGTPVHAALEHDVTIVAGDLVSLVRFEGSVVTDHSRHLSAAGGLALLGLDPAPDAGFALGFTRPFPPDAWVSIAIELMGDSVTRAERERARREGESHARGCAPPPRHCPPPRRGCPCPDDAPVRTRRPRLHACANGSGSGPVTVWEFFGIEGWTSIAAGDVDDETESLTWSGITRLRIRGLMVEHALSTAPPRYWIRCRFVAGAFDAPPVLAAIALNGAIAVQEEGALTEPPSPGNSPAAPGFRLRRRGLDDGTGLPLQRLALADENVVSLSLWSFEDSAWREWTERRDLDASSPADAHFTLDHTSGEISFGDGARGRVIPRDAPVCSAYRFTLGERGNVAPGSAWNIVDDAVGRGLLGASFDATVADLSRIEQVAIAVPGRDEESFAEAAGRAAAELWSHEHLAELAEGAGSESLDGLSPEQVRRATVPGRAATSLDYERLALATPGTTVRRARAWTGFDPDFPGVRAPGTVTVMILPALPRERPVPSRRLISRVRRFLDRRRVIGTRLLVRGPRYVEVGVIVSVALLAGASATRVTEDVRNALDRFLHPLLGGPDGLGWPFGRDVYRSELLQAIDEVRGVDHVVRMSLTADGVPVDCDNVCIGPAALACPGPHQVEVAE